MIPPPGYSDEFSSFAEAIGQLIWMVAIYGGVKVLDWVTKRVKKLIFGNQDHHRALELTHRQDLDIQAKLALLGGALCCQRTFLSRFHNGEKYFDGTEIMRSTRTHEWAADGVSYQADNFRDSLVSEFPAEIELVREKGAGWRSTSDLPLGRFRAAMLAGGTRSVARAEVRIDKHVVGFIGADFGDAVQPLKVEEEMKEFSERIAAILASQR